MNQSEKKIIPFINFSITDKCNYNCEYCAQEERVKRKKQHLAIDASDKTIDNFINIIKNLKEKNEINLIGGEPLLHPRFFELVEAIVSARHNVIITTNFSFPLESYKNLAAICGENLKLSASLHLSQVKSIDDFINKAIEFNTYKIPQVGFNVVSVLTEENFETLKNIKEKLNTHNIKFEFQHLKIHGKDLIKYTKEIQIHLNQPSSYIVKNDKTIKDKIMFGTFCNAGHKSFNILPSGIVKRCYTHQKYFNDIGNIETGNFKPLDKPMPCLAKECKCKNIYLVKNIIEINHKNCFKALYYDFLYKIKKAFKIILKMDYPNV